MPHGTTRVGSIEVTALCDTAPHYPQPFSKAFPTIPQERHDEIRARYPDAFDGPDEWVFHDHCYLIRTPSALILFDTGVGGPETLWAGWVRPGELPGELEAASVAAAEIDVVAVSHAHLDHIGWNVVYDGDAGAAPRFPNARYVLQRAEWEEFPAGGDDEDRSAFDLSVGPLDALGVLHLADGVERLEGGVTLHPTPGHTPGHQVLVVEGGGDRAVLSGDLANHPAQTAEPSWRTEADQDPEHAASTRAEWLDRVEAWNALLCTAHFPDPFGRLRREGGLRSFHPLEDRAGG
jgi:glyoxylase-like metal-dependent hydrolase (beta-lactamase superfamily II)